MAPKSICSYSLMAEQTFGMGQTKVRFFLGAPICNNSVLVKGTGCLSGKDGVKSFSQVKDLLSMYGWVAA